MRDDEIVASGDDSEINRQILEYEKRMEKFIENLIKNQKNLIKNQKEENNNK